VPENLSIKKVGILLRPSTPKLKSLYIRVKELFESYGVEVMIDSIGADVIGVTGCNFDDMCTKSDMLVTIGGDGTLISAVRRSHDYNLPILSINAGRLGFLADINPDELESFLERLMKGEYRIDKRVMLEAVITRESGEKEYSSVALNDIVISSSSNMIRLNSFIEGKLFNSYFGDGLIVSTPTGSTAYNLSAGGPSLFPLTSAYVLTPICPHSLTQRPMVLPSEFEVEITTENDNATLTLDGQEKISFTDKDSVLIRVSKKRACLVHRLERNYFEVIKEKLKWGE